MTKFKVMLTGLFLLMAITVGVWISFGGTSVVGSVGAQAGCIAEPPNMVGWWPGDGDTDDIKGGNHGVLLEGAAFASGKVSQGFFFDGVDDTVEIADSDDLNITGDVTIDLWAMRTEFGPMHDGRNRRMVHKGLGFIGSDDIPTSYSIGFSANDLLSAFFEREDGSNAKIEGPAITDSEFHHYAYVRDGNTHRLLLDGNVVSETAFSGGPGDTAGVPLTIGSQPLDHGTNGYFRGFGGVIDEVEIFNRALDNSEIKGIFDAGSSGKCKSGSPEPTPTPSPTPEPTATPVPLPDTINWSDVTNKPAGFADDTDNDTMAGLNCSFGQTVYWTGTDWVCADASATITVIDNSGDNGNFNSLAIGSDGLGIVSYIDSTSGISLHVAHCLNVACSNAEVSELDTTVSFTDTSITIGTDGLPLIAYANNDGLAVAHCSNLACSNASKNTLSNTVNGVRFGSVVIGADGFGLIGYYDNDTEKMTIAHCENSPCSSATITPLDDAQDVAQRISVTIGGDGLGLISYLANTGLKTAHCDDTACTSATFAAHDSNGGSGMFTSITTGTDGLGLISYYHANEGELRVAHCEDSECTNASIGVIDVATKEYSAITINPEGFGFISYFDTGNGQALKVAQCLNLTCSSVMTSMVDTTNVAEHTTDVAIGVDGLALISYLAPVGGPFLKIAHCANPVFCNP